VDGSHKHCAKHVTLLKGTKPTVYECIGNRPIKRTVGIGRRLQQSFKPMEASNLMLFFLILRIVKVQLYNPDLVAFSGSTA